MPLYEYKCDNTKCPHNKEGKVTERLLKLKNRDGQHCDDCGEELRRIPSMGMRNHISWSTWRI